MSDKTINHPIVSLATRELEVYHMLAKGMKTSEIAKALSLKANTIDIVGIPSSLFLLIKSKCGDILVPIEYLCNFISDRDNTILSSFNSVKYICNA